MNPVLSFDDVWQRVRALAGSTIPLAARGSIKILGVDQTGVLRETSRGHVRKMSIESFRWTVRKLNDQAEISRADILDGIRRWESSGVVATLAATGLYEIARSPVVVLRRASS